MTSRFPIADAAALIGEPSRAAMLLALLDGRAMSAGELARTAELSAPAASLHLGKMLQGGLVRTRREGRHRYYELARVEVAHALEALAAISTVSVAPNRLGDPLRAARSCYDHLAGELGVALLRMLERERYVERHGAEGPRVTDEGARFFARTFDLDVARLAAGRRPLTRACLDLTERVPHLAGALGEGLLTRMLERRWLARRREGRALRVTAAGASALSRLGVR